MIKMLQIKDKEPDCHKKKKDKIKHGNITIER
jgi:hypothetical protein